MFKQQESQGLKRGTGEGLNNLEIICLSRKAAIGLNIFHTLHHHYLFPHPFRYLSGYDVALYAAVFTLGIKICAGNSPLSQVFEGDFRSYIGNSTGISRRQIFSLLGL